MLVQFYFRVAPSMPVRRVVGCASFTNRQRITGMPRHLHDGAEAIGHRQCAFGALYECLTRHRWTGTSVLALIMPAGVIKRGACARMEHNHRTVFAPANTIGGAEPLQCGGR